MSVTTENAPVQGQTTLQENRAGEGVYASLFEKINLTPASRLGDINDFLDDAALSEAPAAERLTAAMQVFMERIRQSGQRVEKLDKTLIDHHIAELDFQISRQLDAVMHHQEFQQVESLWRGLKQLVDNTDYRQNVKTEILDVAKDDLRQDFEDAPELIQSGLYWHTYTAEYDTPGGEPIGSVISAYEFDASPQDVALLRNISRVSAAAHMPFIGAVGPAFFLKETMEEVAAIKDIGNYFDRAEYIRWKAFRETDDARCSRTLVFKRTRVRAVRNLHDVRLAFAYGTADDTAAVAHLKRIHIDVAVVGIVADIDRDDAIGHLSYRLDNGADDATCCRKQAVVFVIGARGVHITVVFTAFHRYGHLGIAQNASRECGKDVEVVRFGADSHLAVVHAARVGVEVAGYIAAGDTAEADPARRVFEQDAVIDHQGSRVFRVGDSALGRTRDAADGERGEVRYQIGCDGARIGERRQR